MLRRIKQSRLPRRAVAAVELALVLPLFAMMAFTGIEAGNVLSVAQRMQSAVRDGGRLASKDVSPTILGAQTANNKVINEVKNILAAQGVPNASVTVTITYADGANVGQPYDLSLPANQYQSFKLQITVPYSSVRIFPFTLYQSKVLTASLVIQRGASSLAQMFTQRQLLEDLAT